MSTASLCVPSRWYIRNQTDLQRLFFDSTILSLPFCNSLGTLKLTSGTEMGLSGLHYSGPSFLKKRLCQLEFTCSLTFSSQAQAELLFLFYKQYYRSSVSKGGTECFSLSVSSLSILFLSSLTGPQFLCFPITFDVFTESFLLVHYVSY